MNNSSSINFLELLLSLPVGPVLLALWVIFGWCASWTAFQKNRDCVAWFVFGCLLGPLALWMLMAVPDLEKPVEKPAAKTVEKPRSGGKRSRQDVNLLTENL